MIDCTSHTHEQNNARSGCFVCCQVWWAAYTSLLIWWVKYPLRADTSRRCGALIHVLPVVHSHTSHTLCQGQREASDNLPRTEWQSQSGNCWEVWHIALCFSRLLGESFRTILRGIDLGINVVVQHTCITSSANFDRRMLNSCDMIHCNGPVDTGQTAMATLQNICILHLSLNWSLKEASLS